VNLIAAGLNSSVSASAIPEEELHPRANRGRPSKVKYRKSGIFNKEVLPDSPPVNECSYQPVAAVYPVDTIKMNGPTWAA
jgi:hypothetical protein